MSPTLIFPVTNLHGSSREDLSEQILRARDAVRAVGRALAEASPNGRDYYPQGDDALRKAIAEHGACEKALAALSDELFALADFDDRDPNRPATLAALSGTIPEKPILPTIHINGTSANFLKESTKAVFLTCQQALEPLSKIVPNGRDYASQEEWVAARDQHHLRAQLLNRVASRFLQLATAAKAAAA
jgi:hypothetical protein